MCFFIASRVRLACNFILFFLQCLSNTTSHAKYLMSLLNKNAKYIHFIPVCACVCIVLCLYYPSSLFLSISILSLPFTLRFSPIALRIDHLLSSLSFIPSFLSLILNSFLLFHIFYIFTSPSFATHPS